MRPSALVLAAALAVSAALPAHAQDYPRLGLYGFSAGNAWPFVNVPSGTLNDPLLDDLSRYHELILFSSPLTEYRPDVLLALRARRPDIKLIAYIWGQNIWESYQIDSTYNYPTRYRRLVDSLGARLYNTRGQYHSLGPVNFAKRTNGRYVMAEAAADIYYDFVVRSGKWDGIFIDVLCSSLRWTQSPAESVDYVRAGYPTFDAFDAAWGAAVDTLGDRLRRLAGPDFLVIGNCGAGTNYDAFNGWMRENFPFQNGDWYTNMFADPGGYLAGDQRFHPPHNDFISTIPQEQPGIPGAAWNARRVRFGLGSAALGNGYGVFNDGAPGTYGDSYMTWWYDEYAVDLSTGRSSAELRHTGWLGQPLAPWRQMIWVGNRPDAVSNSGFETDVTTGWTFASDNGSTIARDATTAGAGSASARIHVTAPGARPWSVQYGTIGTLAMNAGQVYSVTFWAKASASRPITLIAALPVGELTSKTVSIDTTWRQYQVALLPSVSGTASLEMYFSAAAGDVWLDDCHMQLGATTLYRRDFQNGIVLVNPSDEDLAAPLERQYRRILGTVDPVTNDGSLVTQAVVPASDALFLIGDDQIPPANIGDLQTFTAPPAAPAEAVRRPPHRP
jgi:hypothetical protein